MSSDYWIWQKKMQGGRNSGRQNGRRTEEKWTITGNLLSIGMRVDDIAKVTGLSVEEIKKINPL